MDWAQFAIVIIVLVWIGTRVLGLISDCSKKLGDIRHLHYIAADQRQDLGKKTDQLERLVSNVATQLSDISSQVQPIKRIEDELNRYQKGGSFAKHIMDSIESVSIDIVGVQTAIRELADEIERRDNVC